MKKNHLLQAIHLLIVLCLVPMSMSSTYGQSDSDYSSLETLFSDWRSFEQPTLREGAPDYTAATFKQRYVALKDYKQRLDAFDISNWTRSQQVDWYLVLAEMNGFDFNHRILKPWARDPAYYKSVWMARSDVPAHEGPTHHKVTEFWTYTFPLSSSEQDRLIADLSVIAPLMKQAQTNLTGNAKELWIAGIRDIRQQSEDLDHIAETTAGAASPELIAVISEASAATDQLVDWLEEQSSSKTGPSGIGKENYSWYQQNVHMVPLNWEDEVMILRRELARAWSALKLEEQRNKDLPPLAAASTAAEYDALAEESVLKFMAFLEEKEILTIPDYYEPTLRQHMMSFIPEDQRNFFSIGAHYTPLPLYSHFYHWYELARMENDPHPSQIRRDALLYNIFDSRNEGTATAVEEMFMQAGLYADNPRAREVVLIMIAQRAARGLGSLYMHANEMTMEEAGTIHSEYTPRGWMKTEKELLIFEQHLYARQPGYGSSYIVGKYLLEDTMTEDIRLTELAGKEFKLKNFFDKLNSMGNIPIALGRYQMTGEMSPLINRNGRKLP